MVIRAVELTRKIRDKMYEETKSMSKAEYLAYIQQIPEKFQRKTPNRTVSPR